MNPVKRPTIPRVSERALARFHVAVQAMHGADAVTAETLLTSFGSRQRSRAAAELRTALCEFVGALKVDDSPGRPCSATTLGFTLRRHAGVVAAGLTAHAVMKTGRSKVQLWRVATPEQHEAMRIAAGLPAPQPKPRRRQPRIPKLPIPRPDKPIIQRVIRATPHGAARLATVQALRDRLGGHVVSAGNRYHVHLPVRDPSTVDSVIRRLAGSHPGVTFEATDTRDSVAVVNQDAPQPEPHRVPTLEVGAPLARRGAWGWEPFDKF